MSDVGVHEAKTTLSKLLKRVEAGEEITISRGGEPVARLVPVKTDRRRQFGTARGLFSVPSDFDDPLPEAVLDAFER